MPCATVIETGLRGVGGWRLGRLPGHGFRPPAGRSPFAAATGELGLQASSPLAWKCFSSNHLCRLLAGQAHGARSQLGITTRRKEARWCAAVATQSPELVRQKQIGWRLKNVAGRGNKFGRV